MARPLLAVIFGTFTLRLSTGVTGAMLVYYLAVLPEYGGETVRPCEIGVWARCSTRASSSARRSSACCPTASGTAG